MRVFFLSLIVISLADANSEPSNLLDEIKNVKISRSSGKVFLSGKYHGEGTFRCDSNFLEGGMIHFSLNDQKYSYSLQEIMLGSSLISRLEIAADPVRSLASANVVEKWKVEKTSNERGSSYLMSSKNLGQGVHQIRIEINDNQFLQSLYVDFGKYNLSFFSANASL